MRKVLTLDIGNSRTKAAIWQQGALLYANTFETLAPEPIAAWAEEAQAEACVVSSVNAQADRLIGHLREHFAVFHLLTPASKVPFDKGDAFYPTLGSDRIAALVAAFSHTSHEKAVLVVDAGTALTYDFIDAAGRYRGGMIAPGIEMRRQALHTFTSRLPLVDIPSVLISPLAVGTEPCLQAGIVTGLVGEMDYLYRSLQQRFGEFSVLLTGGDAFSLSNFYLCENFVMPNLVLEGLYEVLDCNL